MSYVKCSPKNLVSMSSFKKLDYKKIGIMMFGPH
jgi:hypothetical protein